MADFNFYEPNWSGYLSGDFLQEYGTDSYNNIFDGLTSTYLVPEPEITFTLPSGHPWRSSIDSLRIYTGTWIRTNTGDHSCTVTHSGGTYNVPHADPARWMDIPVTDFYSFSWRKHGAAGSAVTENSYYLVFGVEVNGNVLVNLPQLTGGAASGFNTNQLVGTTNTNYVNVTYSSITRATGTASNPNNFNIQELDDGSSGDHSAERGFLQGRRPHRGLQFPRGYYNK